MDIFFFITFDVEANKKKTNERNTCTKYVYVIGGDGDTNILKFTFYIGGGGRGGHV